MIFILLLISCSFLCPIIFAEKPFHHARRSAIELDWRLDSTSCLGSLQNPLGGYGDFLSNSQEFYHLTPIAYVAKQKASRGKKIRYKLHKISFPSLKVASILSLALPRVSSILVQGEPVQGLIALIFNKRQAICQHGSGVYAIFRLNQKKGDYKVVQGKGDLVVVQGVSERKLFDYNKKSVLEVDFSTLQLRPSIFRHLDEAERPLFVDIAKNNVYTWKFAKKGEPRGLIAYSSGRRVAGRLSFKPGDRLLQHYKYFAVANIDVAKNFILIKKVHRWSGSQSRLPLKDYKIYLPSAFKVSNSGVKVNLKKNLALIYGYTDNVRKIWNKIFLFDFERGWELTSLSAPEGHYVSAVQFSPDGKYAVAEIARMSGLTSSFRIFNLATRKWVKLPVTEKL